MPKFPATLFANGCSMCYGSQLFEDPITKLCFDNHSRFKASWPGIFGKQFGFKRIVNLGYPGSSNDRIVRTTISWILENWLLRSLPTDSLFVIIGWSGPMRREFYIGEEWRQLIPYHDYEDPEASLFNRIYREVAWNEYESAIRFSTQLISLQSFLKFHNIPYLFFDAITPIKDLFNLFPSALNGYLSQIDKNRYFNFLEENGDMASALNCSSANSCNNERTHPNIEGHTSWAQKLVDFTKNSNLFSYIDNSNDDSPLFEGTTSVKIRDRKIGLSPTPSKPFVSSIPIHLLKEDKNRLTKLLSKIQKLLRQDPFIYD